MTSASNDDVRLSRAERDFRVGESYQIWVDAVRPDDFRVHRFQGLGYDLLMLVVSIYFAVAPVLLALAS
jgi:hypothetical protein